MRTLKRYTRRRTAMGDIASTVTTALDVANDPYLTEVVCRVNQLKQIEHGDPVAVCPETPPGLVGGIGMRNAVYPLRGYVFAQQNKWVYPLIVLAVIGLPAYVGYQLGKSSK